MKVSAIRNWLTSVVARTACDALEHTRDPVREIADFLGYRDVASFSRAFQSWTGKTPHAYRNFLT